MGELLRYKTALNRTVIRQDYWQTFVYTAINQSHVIDKHPWKV
jgi:hypothetical protein